MKDTFPDWDGSNLSGEWEATIKIDGVRAVFTDSGVISRKGKPLYNLDVHLKDKTYEKNDVTIHEKGLRGNFEVFLGSFKESNSATRTSTKEIDIPIESLYSLDPIDSRLNLGVVTNLNAADIIKLRDDIIKRGFEGLVLRQGDSWLKIKKNITYDVPITGLKEGTGKNKGKLGAFITTKGNVGIFKGFPEIVREHWYDKKYISKIIEVECMELTADGQFRHGKMLRFREDKDL